MERKVDFVPFNYVFVWINELDLRMLLCGAPVKKTLVSYAFLMRWRHVKIRKYFDKLLRRGISIMVDSGAFSAFNSGIAISLDDYVAFIRKFRDYISLAVNLDVINNGEGTYANWIRFQDKLSDLDDVGLMSVYHDADGWRWYRKLLAEDTKFLGVAGGMSRTNRRQKRLYLDRIFAENPKQHIHGFALTAREAVTDYPFYTADSASWRKIAAYGGIVSPVLDYGNVLVSERKLKEGRSTGHLHTLPVDLQEAVRADFESKGYTYEELATDPMKRSVYNLHVLLEMEAYVNDVREQRAREALYGKGVE